MAHAEQLCFMEVVSRHLAPYGYAGKRILEIGSYDVNGSIRSLFQNSNYTGVDLTVGPGVDIVCEGDKLSMANDSYEVTISCECFEHNPKWLETFLNMYRMTKAGGVLIFTCATTGRLEHGTSRTDSSKSPGTRQIGWNYYRNLTESDFRKNVSFDSLFAKHLFLRNRRCKDLYFVGQKAGGNDIFQLNTQDVAIQYVEASRKLEKSISGSPSYPKLLLRALLRLTLIPVSIAALLPEKYFQNFALYYCKIDTAVKKWALEFIHRNTPSSPDEIGDRNHRR